jgi:TPR repeat protein
MCHNRPVPLRLPIAFLLSLVCLTVPAWADYQAGMDAKNRGDFAKALRELRPLAEQGDARAQFYLGLLSAFGRGGPMDLVQAHMWYSLAAGNGHARAALNRNDLARQMNPAQIADAQKRAREWKPKTP